MAFYKIWIINVSLVISIIVTCLIGDSCLQSKKSQLIRALFDNISHGLIGLFSFGILIAENLENNIILAFLCLVLSCFIDFDHFIQARSFKLSVR